MTYNVYVFGGTLNLAQSIIFRLKHVGYIHSATYYWQLFFIQRLQTVFILVTFYTFFNVFIFSLNVFSFYVYSN